MTQLAICLQHKGLQLETQRCCLLKQLNLAVKCHAAEPVCHCAEWSHQVGCSLSNILDEYDSLAFIRGETRVSFGSRCRPFTGWNAG